MNAIREPSATIGIVIFCCESLVMFERATRAGDAVVDVQGEDVVIAQR